MHTTRRLSWIGLSVALGYLSVGWGWKRAFVWGESQGPYWLFVLMDWTVLPLALVSCLGFVLATVWLVRGLRREGLIRSAALPSVALLLASLSFLGASFPLLLSLLTPLDSLTAQGRVYHLAGITALADDDYASLNATRTACSAVRSTAPAIIPWPNRGKLGWPTTLQRTHCRSPSVLAAPYTRITRLALALSEKTARRTRAQGRRHRRCASDRCSSRPGSYPL